MIINEGETKEIISNGQVDDVFQIFCNMGELSLGRTPQQSERELRTISAGDRVKVQFSKTENIFAHGIEKSEIFISKEGFFLTFDSKKSEYLVDSIQTRKAGYNGQFGSITVNDSVTEIRPFNADRLSLTIQNLGSSNLYIAVGDDSDTVATSDGIEIQPNGNLTIDSYVGSIHGITTSGNSVDVRYIEEVE